MNIEKEILKILRDCTDADCVDDCQVCESKRILALIREHFVELDDDQTLPEKKRETFSYSNGVDGLSSASQQIRFDTYKQAQQDMLNDNWKKVK